MFKKNEKSAKSSDKPMLQGLARLVTFRLLTLLGITPLWRFKNRHKVTIITFHGVMDFKPPTEWQPLRHRASTEELRNCLTVLSRHYQFIDIDKAVAILSGKERPVRNALVVSFDDGYKNNFEYAAPILEALEIPAVYYVATSVVDPDTHFWFDRLDYAIQSAAAVGEDVEVAGVRICLSASDRDSLIKTYSDIRHSLKSQIMTEKEFRTKLNLIAERLESIAGSSISNLKNDLWTAVASWDDLRTASSKSLITIGSHSVSHSRLMYEEPDVVRDEVFQSKEKIERELGLECKHFAFPNGAHSEYARQMTAKAGYLSAVTTDKGTNEIGSDLHALKRLYPSVRVDACELYAGISGLQDDVASFLSRIRKCAKTAFRNA